MMIMMMMVIIIAKKVHEIYSSLLNIVFVAVFATYFAGIVCVLWTHHHTMVHA